MTKITALPVRIGNGAHDQVQIDVFGELMDLLHTARKSKLNPNQEAWRFQQAMILRLEGLWRDPDEGIWEVRGEPARKSSILR